MLIANNGSSWQNVHHVLVRCRNPTTSSYRPQHSDYNFRLYCRSLGVRTRLYSPADLVRSTGHRGLPQGIGRSDLDLCMGWLHNRGSHKNRGHNQTLGNGMALNQTLPHTQPAEPDWSQRAIHQCSSSSSSTMLLLPM
jgi:hypothetical protein